MGMDHQSTLTMQDGVNLFDNITRMTNGPAAQTANPTEADARAGLMELDARDEAADRQRLARKEAAGLRETEERLRAKAAAQGGQSGLAMSGSRQLVRDSERIQDQLDEDELLTQGLLEGQKTLNRGRHKANLLRIRGNTTPNRSTLSLGSNIYKYGG